MYGGKEGGVGGVDECRRECKGFGLGVHRVVWLGGVGCERWRTGQGGEGGPNKGLFGGFYNSSD